MLHTHTMYARLFSPHKWRGLLSYHQLSNVQSICLPGGYWQYRQHHFNTTVSQSTSYHFKLTPNGGGRSCCDKSYCYIIRNLIRSTLHLHASTHTHRHAHTCMGIQQLHALRPPRRTSSPWTLHGWHTRPPVVLLTKTV